MTPTFSCNVGADVHLAELLKGVSMRHKPDKPMTEIPPSMQNDKFVFKNRAVNVKVLKLMFLCTCSDSGTCPFSINLKFCLLNMTM